MGGDARRVNDDGSLQALKLSAERLRKAAHALEPGVLEALDELEHPSRFRAIAADLLDQMLYFLDELVFSWGASGPRPLRHNQTYEAALRHAIRHRRDVGDLAELARTELRRGCPGIAREPAGVYFMPASLCDSTADAAHSIAWSWRRSQRQPAA
jgi:hypothetical protein